MDNQLEISDAESERQDKSPAERGASSFANEVGPK
jgi:hypothetical protein